MKGLEFKFLCLGLIAVMFFSSGCVSAQKTKKMDELQAQIAQLTQKLNDKEAQLQGAEAACQSALQALQNELQECKTQQVSSPVEVQENLK